MRPRARKCLEYRFGVLRRDMSRSSYPAKAGYPVPRSFSGQNELLWNTGSPAFAGDDSGGWIDIAACKGSNRTTALFDNLSEKLGGILDRLTGRGSLSEADVDAAMREVRRALLEADVALEVVRSFTDRVREQAVGATVVKSVTPGQMVVKIVPDELSRMLGADGQTIHFNAVPPVAIMMV